MLRGWDSRAGSDRDALPPAILLSRGIVEEADISQPLPLPENAVGTCLIQQA